MSTKESNIRRHNGEIKWRVAQLFIFLYLHTLQGYGKMTVEGAKYRNRL